MKEAGTHGTDEKKKKKRHQRSNCIILIFFFKREEKTNLYSKQTSLDVEDRFPIYKQIKNGNKIWPTLVCYLKLWPFSPRKSIILAVLLQTSSLA